MEDTSTALWDKQSIQSLSVVAARVPICNTYLPCAEKGIDDSDELIQC